MEERVNQHYQTLCNRFDEDYVFFVFLYGSQNYGLDTSESDVDTKAVVFLRQADLIIKTKIWEPMRIQNELCYISDLYTFLQDLTFGDPKSYELFISKYVKVNPKYKELFQMLVDFNAFIYHDFSTQLLLRSVEVGWACYRCALDSNSTKPLIHAYRNFLVAQDIHNKKPIEKCLQCSATNKEQIKKWKSLECPPTELISLFTDISAKITNLLENISEETPNQLPEYFEQFCIQAYFFQQKNLA